MPDEQPADPKAAILELLKLMLDDQLSKEEFTKSFAIVVDSIDTLRTDNRAEFDAMRGVIDALAQKLTADNTTDLTSFKNTARTELDAVLAACVKRMEEHMSDMERRVAQLRDGEKGEKGDQGIQGPPGKDGSPDMAEDIRNKLELLEGDDRLDASAIKGLDEYVKKAAPTQSGTNFVVQRGAVKIYDLSDLLDGSTKTFSLPAFWRVLTVDLSSFPNALRPTVDFTTDGAAMTITFAATIDASTSLAAGQTCIVTYAEA